MKEAFFFSVTSAVQFTGRAPAGFDTETHVRLNYMSAERQEIVHNGRHEMCEECDTMSGR